MKWNEYQTSVIIGIIGIGILLVIVIANLAEIKHFELEQLKTLNDISALLSQNNFVQSATYEAIIDRIVPLLSVR